MNSAPITTIFLDAGGTLLYPHPSVGEIYARTARRHGLEVPVERMEQAFRTSWNECHANGALTQDSETHALAWWRQVVFKALDSLGAEMPDREAYFLELYEIFAQPDVWRLYPETLYVLDELTRRGFKLGLISNWDHRLRPLLSALGLVKYFRSISISAEVGAEKPRAAIFEHALQSMGATPNESIHVGDSLRDDVHGARSAGMLPVFLERNGNHPACGVPVIRCLRELADF